MTKQPYSEQTIGNLTRGQLEEIINAQENKAQALTATFGNWEDERTEEEIIKDIYDNRNSNLTSI